jgi:alpha-amylase
MTPFFLILLIISISILNIFCRSKEEWKSRTIYQLLTDRFASTTNSDTCDITKYCGGNYQGILQKLDYIEGMGFNAIWISPIIENINNEWAYHGYSGINFYALNSHFGTEEDLINLITECHKRDIWIMVDVVANHVGGVGTDFSQIDPFNLAEHYHDWC